MRRGRAASLAAAVVLASVVAVDGSCASSSLTFAVRIGAHLPGAAEAAHVRLSRTLAQARDLLGSAALIVADQSANVTASAAIKIAAETYIATVLPIPPSHTDARVLNSLVSHSSTELILFTEDSDELDALTDVRAMCAAFRDDPDLDVLGGSYRDAAQQPIDPLAWRYVEPRGQAGVLEAVPIARARAALRARGSIACDRTPPFLMARLRALRAHPFDERTRGLNVHEAFFLQLRMHGRRVRMSNVTIGSARAHARSPLPRSSQQQLQPRQPPPQPQQPGSSAVALDRGSPPAWHPLSLSPFSRLARLLNATAATMQYVCKDFPRLRELRTPFCRYDCYAEGMCAPTPRAVTAWTALHHAAAEGDGRARAIALERVREQHGADPAPADPDGADAPPLPLGFGPSALRCGRMQWSRDDTSHAPRGLGTLGRSPAKAAASEHAPPPRVPLLVLATTALDSTSGRQHRSALRHSWLSMGWCDARGAPIGWEALFVTTIDERVTAAALGSAGGKGGEAAGPAPRRRALRWAAAPSEDDDRDGGGGGGAAAVPSAWPPRAAAELASRQWALYGDLLYLHAREDDEAGAARGSSTRSGGGGGAYASDRSSSGGTEGADPRAALRALRWAARHVGFDYLLRTFDSSFVDVSRMWRYATVAAPVVAEGAELALLYAGAIAHGVQPARSAREASEGAGADDDGSAPRPIVSRRAFSEPVLPDFAKGSGYLLSAPAARALLGAHDTDERPMVRYEDVYVGLLAATAGVPARQMPGLIALPARSKLSGFSASGWEAMVHRLPAHKLPISHADDACAPAALPGAVELSSGEGRDPVG